MPNLKKIGITIGDPAGIGIEVTLKSLLCKDINKICKPLIIGDKAVIQLAIEKMNIPLRLNSLDLLNISEIKDGNFLRGKPSAQCGKASVMYIKKAVELVSLNIIDAIVTAPITKESLKMAGFNWSGHTDMLAELTGTKDFRMAFSGGKLNIILVTIHTALKNVPPLITKDSVLKTIFFAQKTCKMMGIENPAIAVCGLNPHKGEAGIFGDEEIFSIIPAIKKSQKLGINISGPYPADSLFYEAYTYNKYDIIICMYHDQGLIPLKMIAFDKGVNITIGLPFIRTSPDHGTALNIAWQGCANPSSMIEAIKLASKLKIQ